jgi:hypothetical protein
MNTASKKSADVMASADIVDARLLLWIVMALTVGDT